MRQRYEYLSPRSNPAVIFGCPLLHHSWADPPSWAARARIVLADLKVLRTGGRPSHLIFRECPKGELRRILLWRSSRNTPPRRLSEYRRMSLRTEAVDGGRTHHAQKSEVRFRGGLLQRRWPAGAGLQARHRRRGHLRGAVGTLRRRGDAAADGGRGTHPQQADYRRAPQAG